MCFSLVTPFPGNTPRKKRQPQGTSRNNPYKETVSPPCLHLLKSTGPALHRKSRTGVDYLFVLLSPLPRRRVRKIRIEKCVGLPRCDHVYGVRGLFGSFFSPTECWYPNRGRPDPQPHRRSSFPSFPTRLHNGSTKRRHVSITTVKYS